MPDALSKTIPIWCNTVNRLLFIEHPESQILRLPADIVSGSERAQIEARIKGYLEDAKVLLQIFMPCELR